MSSIYLYIQDLAGDSFLSSTNHLFRLRDERAMRCRSCSVRLEDGGGSICSLDCSLLELINSAGEIGIFLITSLVVVLQSFLW